MKRIRSDFMGVKNVRKKIHKDVSLFRGRVTLWEKIIFANDTNLNYEKSPLLNLSKGLELYYKPKNFKIIGIIIDPTTNNTIVLILESILSIFSFIFVNRSELSFSLDSIFCDNKSKL